MAIELASDFKEFLKLLNSHHVEYLLIGGYAVSYHGYPRATNDLDIWIAVHPGNAERLVQVMQSFGLATPELSTALFLQENKIIRMGRPPIRIELLTSISGVDFAECYVRRLIAEVDGVPVSMIGLEDLKQNKEASGRYKDLNDLENLP
jgi:predicted nucleotidyltransferase